MQSKKKNITKYIIFNLYAIVALIMAVICVHKNNLSKIYVYNNSNIEIIKNDDDTKNYKTVEAMLSAKKHYIDLAYKCSSESSLEIFVDNGNMISTILPATIDTGAIQTFEIQPKNVTDRMRIKLHTPLDFEIIQINLRADSPLYYDYLLYAIMFIMSIPLFVLLINKYQKSENKILFIAMAILYILSVIYVFIRWNMIPFGADTRDHLQRIQGIMQGFYDDQRHVLIYPNMNNEYGQTAALYPSLFIYIPAILRYFNISLLLSYNIMLVIINIATVFIMYHVSMQIFKNEKIAIAATFIHVFDGSRIMCYMSGSMLATGLAMLFIPLLIYGIYTLIIDENPKWQYLALGLFGVTSSHVLQTVISFGVIIMIFVACAKISANKKTITALLKSIFVYIIMSLGTIIPFIRFYLMGFSQDKLVLDEFVESQYDLEDFFVKKPHALMTLIIVALSLIIVIWLAKNNKKIVTKRDYYFRCLFFVYIICMIMLSELFPWLWLQRFDVVKTFTNMVQYPMRILGSTSVIVAFIFAYALEKITDKESVKNSTNKYLTISNVAITVMLIVTLCCNIAGTKEYIDDEPLVYDRMIGFFNSRNNEDYLPIGTKTEYYNTDSGSVSDEEKIESLFYEKRFTHINYSYKTESEGEYAIFPLFYYDGYTALDENKEHYEVKKSEENKVMVMLKKADEPKTVILYYKVSPIYVIIDMICAVCVIICLYSLMKTNKKSVKEVAP